MRTLDTVLRELAERRWMELRDTHNRTFMTLGPGSDWENWQRRAAYLYEEDALLSVYLGKDPLRGPQPEEVGDAGR